MVEWTEAQVLENYPGLSRQSLRAVFAFAAETARDDELFVLSEASITGSALEGWYSI